MTKQFRYDDVPPVETKAGKIHGYYFDGVYIFKGVPYAQAGRFQMPQEVDSWDGVRDTCSYGYVSPMLMQDNPNEELIVPHRYWPMDENCLNLNVWTKELNANAKKPVLVWFHGGAFSMGSSIEQEAYDGANMCKEGDVVVVSVNHRLNILGFLDLSPFGDKYAHSANAGLADLVASLQWVKDNIAKMGGDPDNVTIFGQSGGGMKVTCLMQIPAADGLFHKAFVMSGAVSDDVTMLYPKGKDGKQIVKALMDELQFTDVEQLETVSYHDLTVAYNKVSMEIAKQGGYFGAGPLANDYYVGNPVAVGFTEHAKTIPLMVGTAFSEFNYIATSPYANGKLPFEQEKALLEKIYGEHTDRVIELFKEAYPDKRLLDLLAIDRFFRLPSKSLARLMGSTGKAPAYLYNFTLSFDYKNEMCAWHCADIPFVFNNADKIEVCNIEGVSEKLEAKMFGALMQFAKTGNPNHEGIPNWPPVTDQAEPTMLFDRKCYVADHYDDELYALIEEVVPMPDLYELAMDKQH